MKTKKIKVFNFPSDKISDIEEKIMFESILEYARKFYENPKNIQAFEEWRKKKNEQ